jgi:Tol biopolymer transport system component
LFSLATYDLYLLGTENGKPRGDLQLLRQDFGANAGGFLTRDGRLLRAEVALTYDSFIVPVDEQTGKPTDKPSQIDPDFSAITNPTWSPDGKLLYYYRTKGLRSWGEGVLVVRSEETGEIREITPKSNLKWSDRPLMSPDGSQFVVTLTDGKMYIDVFTIDSKSGEVSQVTKIPATTVSGIVSPCPNWSPDGKAIFYKVRSPEKSEEFIILHKDLTTGEEKEVYRGMHTRDMKLSPDGTRFVYFRNDSPTKSYVLGILDIKSGKEMVLWQVPEADAPGGISEPKWIPDGKYVLVTRDLNQGSELWRFPVAGGPGEKLYFSPMKSAGFAMHPSGNRMAFTQYRWNFELWALENFLPK